MADPKVVGYNVELPLVPQTVEPDWWHVFRMRDGHIEIMGPTTLDPNAAKSWGDGGDVYLKSFDHDPTDKDLEVI